MLASTHFGIQRGKDDDWFDTILDVDTELFVDPFLIFKETSGRWAGAHDKLVGHFNQAFLLVAKANSKPSALAYKKALALLVFTEPRELCLGYTSRGTRGAGSGSGFALLIAKAIVEAIKRGLNNPAHFEELGILQEGIGADRISDIACTILKPDLIGYTQEIAKRHKIPFADHRVYAAEFDAKRLRFRTAQVKLPTNPITNGPLLFVPERFLDRLPALNADDWWSNYENERLRDDVNYDVMGNVDKATIVRTARAHHDSVRAWAQQKEGQPARPYDFDKDPKGVVQWEHAANAFTAKNPLAIEPPDSAAGFDAVIETVIDQYRLLIEQQRGWYLLWDGTQEKPELAAQLAFFGVARNYCQANNIVLDREVELGRGPVDFKFSNGYEHRAHLEIKKLHSGRFWNGLDAQLPSYLASDQADRAWFIGVRYRDGKKWDERQRELPARIKAAASTHGRILKGTVVDARKPKSASKL